MTLDKIVMLSTIATPVIGGVIAFVLAGIRDEIRSLENRVARLETLAMEAKK